MRALTSLRRCRRGLSALEFGLVAPFLVLVLSGLVDLGHALQRTIVLENAARAGAHFAMSFPQETASIAAAVRAALGGVEATVTVQGPNCVCGDGSPASCDGLACPGTPPTPSRVFVRVIVAAPYQPLIGFGRYVLPETLRGEAIARVR
ncbi:TadE/TadG family type IV pilus assembly protein [Elioraea thermophila]|uniref:TadE/TadG family type IV pilus assembly protein n=1 Tax=Elioraea thermophila TaxID=2185104 RepID=UPI000DF48348|nr:TadE family protein [Elioraea thermophila]